MRLDGDGDYKAVSWGGFSPFSRVECSREEREGGTW